MKKSAAETGADDAPAKKPRKAPARKKAPPPPPPPADEEEAEEAEPEEEPAPEPAPPPKKRPRTRTAALAELQGMATPKTSVLAVPSAEFIPEAAPPKKAAKRVKKGKVEEAPAALPPPRAESVAPATDLAPKRAKRVGSAAAPAASHSGEAKSFRSRWERERHRTPAIGQLVPGTVLKRNYLGKEHVVEVEEGCYRYHNERFPTLYAVTTKITGEKCYPKQQVEGRRLEGMRKMSNWSATRFFNLKSLQ